MKEVLKVKTRSGRAATRISLKSNVQASKEDKPVTLERRTRSTQKIINESSTNVRGATNNICKAKEVKNASTLKAPTCDTKQLNRKTTKPSHDNESKKDISPRTTRNTRTKPVNTVKSNIGKQTLKTKTNSVEVEENEALKNEEHLLKDESEFLNNRRNSRSFSKLFGKAGATSTPIVNKNVKTKFNIPTKLTQTNEIKETETNTKINKSKQAAKVVGDSTKTKVTVKEKLPIYKRINKSPEKRVKIQTNLRPRIGNKKYADFVNTDSNILDEDDEDKPTENENVPIYRKAIKEPVKKTKDVYHFDANSFENTESDSDYEYDKGIVDEMLQIKKKERQQNTAVIKKLIANKFRRKRKVPQEIVKKQTKKEVKSVQIKQNTVSDKDLKTKKVNKVTVLKDIQLNISVPSGQPQTDKKKQDLIDNNSTNHDNLVDDIVDDFMESENEIETNETSQINLNEKPQMQSPQNLVCNIVDSFMEPDFDEILNSTFKKPLLQSTNFPKGISNTNITNEVPCPRRSNLIFRNGPYILQTKGDNLPAFNQTMVLNSTMVEAHEPHFNCRLSAILPPATQNDQSVNNNETIATITTPPTAKPMNQTTNNQKQTKQTSILSYISGKKSQDEHLNCTLFDENLLISPVKISTPVESIRASPDKKRVLRDLTNFNFQSSITNTPGEESEVEFFRLSAGGAQVKPGKPTRFVLKSPKRVANLAKEKNNDDIVCEKVVNVSVFNSPEANSKTHEGDEDNGETELKNIVGVFEDFNVTRDEVPSFTYARRRKRVRQISYESDHEDQEEDYKPKRKKGGEMTKKQKEEFDAWATSFNQACDEIEEYSLEVE